MPQISLYIDEKTLKEVEKAASDEQISMSKWVVKRIQSQLKPTYPDNFANLFGSIGEDSLTRPDQLSMINDAKRESL
jgi:hypothetical protein